MNHEQFTRLILLLHFLKLESNIELDEREYKNIPKELFSHADKGDLILSFEKWRKTLLPLLGEKFFDSDSLKNSTHVPNYKESFLADSRNLHKYFSVSIFTHPYEAFSPEFLEYEERFDDGWMVINQKEFSSNISSTYNEIIGFWYKGQFRNNGYKGGTKMLSPQNQVGVFLSIIRSDLDEFSPQSEENTEFMFFLKERDDINRKDINLWAILLYLQSERCVSMYLVRSNFQKKGVYVRARINKYHIERLKPNNEEEEAKSSIVTYVSTPSDIEIDTDIILSIPPKIEEKRTASQNRLLLFKKGNGSYEKEIKISPYEAFIIQYLYQTKDKPISEFGIKELAIVNPAAPKNNKKSASNAIKSINEKCKINEVKPIIFTTVNSKHTLNPKLSCIQSSNRSSSS